MRLYYAMFVLFCAVCALCIHALMWFYKGVVLYGAHLQWDRWGDSLAVVPRGSSAVLVWHRASQTTARLDTGFKVPLPPAFAHSQS